MNLRAFLPSRRMISTVPPIPVLTGDTITRRITFSSLPECKNAAGFLMSYDPGLVLDQFGRFVEDGSDNHGSYRHVSVRFQGTKHNHRYTFGEIIDAAVARLYGRPVLLAPVELVIGDPTRPSQQYKSVEVTYEMGAPCNTALLVFHGVMVAAYYRRGRKTATVRTRVKRLYITTAGDIYTDSPE